MVLEFPSEYDCCCWSVDLFWCTRYGTAVSGREQHQYTVLQCSAILTIDSRQYVPTCGLLSILCPIGENQCLHIVRHMACMYVRISDMTPKIKQTKKQGSLLTIGRKFTRLAVDLKTKYVQIPPRRLVFLCCFYSFSYVIFQLFC